MQANKAGVADRLIPAMVCRAAAGACSEGGRVGTRYGVTLQDLFRGLGPPHEAAPVDQWRRYDLPLLDGAGKVSAIWYVTTPRGVCAIRDYWWNCEDELSLAARDSRATLWVHRWLDRQGLGKRNR